MDEVASNEEGELPPSTVPNYTLSLEGFADEATARKLGEPITWMTRAFGRCFPLQDLAGIVVAYDYRAALKAVDRGFGASASLTPSDEFGHGVAMAPLVLRDGKPKTQLVLSASIMEELLQHEDPEKMLATQAAYTLFHELAHCVEHTQMERNLPGFLLSSVDKHFKTRREMELYSIVNRSWNEYFACRVSAIFSDCTRKAYDEVFGSALAEIPQRLDREKVFHRFRGDFGGLFRLAANDISTLMTFASYVFGHLDGRGLEPDAEATPAIHAAMTGRFGEALAELRVALRGMWDQLGTWDGNVAVFNPLFASADAFLKAAGLRVEQLEDDTLYIHILH